MSLTFYVAPMSTASTVHWSLEELQIPYEAVQVDIHDAADKRKKLGPVNPNGAVPVLVHDGVPIFESVAIQIYLGETFGVDKGLYPEAGPARAAALKWLVWANVTLGGAITRWLSNTKGAPELQNPVAGKQARKDVDRLVGMLEDELGDREYLLDSGVSLVDFHLVSLFQWVTSVGIDLAPFPKVSAWVERCSARPANLQLMAA